MMSEHPELPDLIRKTGVPVPQVLDRSGETLAWKPAEDMAPKLDDLIEALGARATEQTLAEIKTLLGDGNQKVQLTGSYPELRGLAAEPSHATVMLAAISALSANSAPPFRSDYYRYVREFLLVQLNNASLRAGFSIGVVSWLDTLSMC